MKQLVQKVSKDLALTKNDAEITIARLLNCPRHELYRQAAQKSYQPQLLRYKLMQLKNNIPIEYITKTVSFFDLELTIYPGVFIPRVETEFLIEIVANNVPVVPQRIFEVGTGTAAISIALARIFHDCTITASDISHHALNCARINIKKYNLEKRIILGQLNGLNSITGQYDLIISNPPYVSFERIRQLPKSVRDFEPMIALYGGFDGAGLIKEIILRGHAMLNTSGMIALEIDDNQTSIIKDLLILNKINNYRFFKDFYGRFRYLTISKEKI